MLLYEIYQRCSIRTMEYYGHIVHAKNPYYLFKSNGYHDIFYMEYINIVHSKEMEYYGSILYENN